MILHRKAKKTVTKGRQQIADVLNAKRRNLFHSRRKRGWQLGTQSYFWSIQTKGNHIITTKIEHHAILHTCEYLEKRRKDHIPRCRWERYRPPWWTGESDHTRDHPDLRYVCKQRDRFHPADQRNRTYRQRTRHPVPHRCSSGILSGSDRCRWMQHRYVKLQRTQDQRTEGNRFPSTSVRGVKIRSFVHGGAQERKRRAGTENVPGIVGYGAAAERNEKHERAYREGDRTEIIWLTVLQQRSHTQTERWQSETSSEQRKRKLPVHRGRIHVSDARLERHLCIKRICLHIRFPGSVPCTSCYRRASWSCSWFSETYLKWRDN